MVINVWAGHIYDYRCTILYPSLPKPIIDVSTIENDENDSCWNSSLFRMAVFLGKDEVTSI